MRGLLTVARREIEDRKQVLLAAAIAGFVPFFVALVRGLNGIDASDARQWTAVILAVAFGFGLSLGLGLTTLATDIANRRIAFYWARPLSGWAIWLGKLTAVWLLSLAAAFLAFLPSLVVDGVRVFPRDLNSVTPGLFLLALLGVVVASHALSVAARSRSVLLLGDLIGLGLAYLATRAMSLRLLQLFAGGAVLTNFTIAEVSLAVGLLAGGAAAVLVGRTQIQRAHRAQSRVLWSVMAGGLAIVGAHTLWVLTAPPSSISTIESIDPGGSRGWVTLMGSARANYATFAFNVNDGRYARVPTTFRKVAFDRSGSLALWFEADSGSSVRAVAWNLSRPDAKPSPTRISLPEFPFAAFLSGDGGQLATFDYRVLNVYDVASGALLGSARVSGRLFPGQALFVTSRRVRFLLQEADAQDTRIAILEFDVEAKKLKRTGQIAGVRLDPFPSVSPDGNRIIVRDQGSGQVLLVDGITGRQEAVLVEDRDPRSVPACFLSGDRVAVSAEHGHRIRVWTPNGQIERDLALPVAAFDFLGESVEGRLSLSLREGRGVGVLDLASGKLDEFSDLRPTERSWWREKADPVQPGSEVSMLFFGKDGSLIHVNPSTGKRRVVLRKGAR